MARDGSLEAGRAVSKTVADLGVTDGALCHGIRPDSTEGPSPGGRRPSPDSRGARRRRRELEAEVEIRRRPTSSWDRAARAHGGPPVIDIPVDAESPVRRCRRVLNVSPGSDGYR